MYRQALGVVTDTEYIVLTPDVTPPPPPPTETCSVLFTVVDELGNPLEGATVNLNGESGTTDDQGTLLFTDISLKTYDWSVSLAGYAFQSGQVECTETINYEIPVTLITVIPWVLPASLIVGLFLFILGSKN